MSILTADAARRLGLSVPELLDLAAPLIEKLSEAWPEIDEAYLVTLEQLYRLSREQTETRASQPPANRGTEEPSPVEEARLRILDKLERGDRWGVNTVKWDTLRNHYCQRVNCLEEALNELIIEDLIIVAGKGNKRKGPFSLNPAKKGLIEAELNKIRS